MRCLFVFSFLKNFAQYKAYLKLFLHDPVLYFWQDTWKCLILYSHSLTKHKFADIKEKLIITIIKMNINSKLMIKVITLLRKIQ